MVHDNEFLKNKSMIIANIFSSPIMINCFSLRLLDHNSIL
jgi:hypothetical protein